MNCRDFQEIKTDLRDDEAQISTTEVHNSTEKPQKHRYNYKQQ